MPVEPISDCVFTALEDEVKRAKEQLDSISELFPKDKSHPNTNISVDNWMILVREYMNGLNEAVEGLKAINDKFEPHATVSEDA